MSFRKISILFVILCLITNNAFSQQNPVKKDSTTLYRNIESYSKQSKFKTFIYRLIFKPVATLRKKSETKRNTYRKLIQKPYSSFEGKPIRNISIVTMNPFGYSDINTPSPVQSFLYKAGNALHVKTRVPAIKNLLLIRKNQPFNAFRVKESERLIRSQKYVHEVFFFVVLAGEKSDSVDIAIREWDNWSILPSLSLSGTSFNIGLADKNFLGYGQTFQNSYYRNFSRNLTSFKTDYMVPNIKNTYTSLLLHYGVDGFGNYSRGVAVDRPFYSTLAKWGAGISLSAQSVADSMKDINQIYVPLNYKFNTLDIWGGKAFRIAGDDSEEGFSTNLIMSARYLRIRYPIKPLESNDPLHIFSNEDFYFAEIGISTRRYVQDKFIYNYGVTEDVPVGKVYSLTGGYQVKNNLGRYYLGMRLSSGNYNESGYLSYNFEVGTFFQGSKAQQGVFSAGVNYFTGLIEIGKWKFRQFLNPQIFIGINRFSYDSLTLKDGYGLTGFNSLGLSGTNRVVFTLQTQAYSPWNLIGFHLGPYLSYSMGMLGNASTGFKKSKVYSQFGIGVMIKNANLVFNTFQFSISFYPIIPGLGQNVFKTNSFRTNDLGFRDFEIGKPAIVQYR